MNGKNDEMLAYMQILLKKIEGLEETNKILLETVSQLTKQVGLSNAHLTSMNSTLDPSIRQGAMKEVGTYYPAIDETKGRSRGSLPGNAIE